MSVRSLTKWSDENLIGGKTGYTFEAGHCFVCAAECQNKRIIVAVLGSPSRKPLWKETEELIHKGFNAPADADQEAGTVDGYLKINLKKGSL